VRDEPRLNREIIEAGIALAVAGLAAVGLVHSLGFPRQSAYLPVAVTGLACVLSLAWAVQALRRKPRQSLGIERDHVRRFAIMVGTGTAYAIMVGGIGFFTATLLFIPLTGWTLGLRRPIPLLVAAGTFTFGIYLIFGLLLQRPLPRERLLELALSVI
jgi:putative tricarboxylic transport membrane protein